MGLERAGFDVVGVDIEPQPHYRGGTFVQADALTYPLDGFDFVWASPPCQAHTVLRRLNPGRVYPDLIPATRERLQASGTPWCIENVPGAPLGGANLTMLCGSMFGLMTSDGRAELRRHRLFETSFSIPLRPACQHGHESLSVTGHATQVSASNWGRRKVLTVVGHTPVDNTGRRPRTIVEDSDATLFEVVTATGRRSHREVITVSGDRPNSANTPRVICVAGGKAMSGGMMTPRGKLNRRAISVTGNTAQTNTVRKHRTPDLQHRRRSPRDGHRLDAHEMSRSGCTPSL